MSELEKLTKEEQETFYKIHQFMKEIQDDLRTTEDMMLKGRFIEAIDYIRSSNVKSQLGQRDLIELVQKLKDKNIW
jgi:hypothetical protein